MRGSGTVTIWNPARAFGWIVADAERISVFAHINDVRGKYHLRVGDLVTFELIRPERGPKAIDILIVPDAAAKGGE